MLINNSSTLSGYSFKSNHSYKSDYYIYAHTLMIHINLMIALGSANRNIVAIVTFFIVYPNRWKMSALNFGIKDHDNGDMND